MVWREARAKSSFAMLLPHLREVLAVQRDLAACKGRALGLAPYDALLDQFDPGLRRSWIDPLFDRLRSELPGMIARAQDRQRGERLVPIAGTYPVGAQRALGETLMRTVGFDFARGRLDTSLHPFCGGATDDVRITTRYTERDFTRALMGVLHETGHALYEQGRPAQWLRQPVGEARGMVMHESQSLLIEMQACRTREFLAYLAPLLREAFGAEPALEDGNLHWPSGAWGYFPTYTLGAIAAAQLFAAACAAEPDLRARLATGDFTGLVGWLRSHVHAKGSLLDTDALMREATGRPLGIDAYLGHLSRRYPTGNVH